MCVHLCKRRHGRIMTSRPKPFEKGTAEGRQSSKMTSLSLLHAHSVHVPFIRTHLHFILQSLGHWTLNMHTIRRLYGLHIYARRACNDPLYYSSLRTASNIIFSSSIFIKLYRLRVHVRHYIRRPQSYFLRLYFYSSAITCLQLIYYAMCNPKRLTSVAICVLFLPYTVELLQNVTIQQYVFECKRIHRLR